MFGADSVNTFETTFITTACPRSLGPFDRVTYYKKIGQDFLDILYMH